jgi:hypothetical protein
VPDEREDELYDRVIWSETGGRQPAGELLFDRGHGGSHQRPHVVKVFFKEFGKDLTSSTTY